jgi:hypothetical protein
MLIQSLEQKTKLALMTVILTLAACTVICIFTVYQSSKLVSEERSQIYILDGDIPFLAERSSAGSQLRDGGQGTYPALPSVLLQPAAR